MSLDFNYMVTLDSPPTFHPVHEVQYRVRLCTDDNEMELRSFWISGTAIERHAKALNILTLWYSLTTHRLLIVDKSFTDEFNVPWLDENRVLKIPPEEFRSME